VFEAVVELAERDFRDRHVGWAVNVGSAPEAEAFKLPGDVQERRVKVRIAAVGTFRSATSEMRESDVDRLSDFQPWLEPCSPSGGPRRLFVLLS